MIQDAALDILKSGANVFLTGEPGSGKTHTTNAYVSWLRGCGVEVAVTASTGIAATHLGGLTLHAWSGVGVRKSLTAHDVAAIAGNERVAKRILKTKSLIIDEISMLDAAVLDSVDRVCRAVRNSDEPFGGLQIVFVGDFFQLPPVARAGEPAPRFAYAADAWRAARPLVCYLSEQHRQEDAAFLEILLALRRDDVTPTHTEMLDERRITVEHMRELRVTKLFPHNADVDAINNAELAKIPDEERVFLMESIGPEGLVEGLKRGCLSPERLILKKNAIVMFTKNDLEGHYVNGSMGTVVGFGRETGNPVVKLRSGEFVTATPDEWAIEEKGKVRARIVQTPLRLAWAITIHKSQGMSLDAAVVDLSGAFVAGQGYVALSRLRSLAGLHLLGYNRAALQVHPAILAVDEEFHRASDEADAAFAAMQREELRKMQENFVISSGGNIKSQSESSAQRGRFALGTKTKQPRHTLTARLAREGKTFAEIVREHKRAPSTIIEHLEEAHRLGDVAVADLVSVARDAAHDVALARAAFAKFPEGAEGPLRPVFDALEGSIGYDTIRLARLLYLAEKGKTLPEKKPSPRTVHG